jgi:hypothetical protein
VYVGYIPGSRSRFGQAIITEATRSMYASCSFWLFADSGIAGTFNDLTYSARSGLLRSVLRSNFSLDPCLILNLLLIWEMESSPMSWISSYRAFLAASHHFLQLAPIDIRSRIQHVEQLRLEWARCDFFSSAKILSRTSSGSFLNPSPGILRWYGFPKYCFVGLDCPLPRC